MDPYNEWEYREIECKVFMVDDIELIGYAKFADEWMKLVEMDTSEGIKKTMDELESEIDKKIRRIKIEEKNKGTNIIDDFNSGTVSHWNFSTYNDEFDTTTSTGTYSLD